jgi:CRP-like cAMP-binding protein
VTASELKRVGLLADFGDEDREALAEVLEEREVAAGRSLFFEGEEASCLFFIAEGVLDLASARVPEIGMLGAGACIGAASLVTFGKREANAVARQPARVWQLDRFAFRRLAEDAPRTACRLLEAIAAQLAHALRPALEHVAAVDPDPTDP